MFTTLSLHKHHLVALSRGQPFGVVIYGGSKLPLRVESEAQSGSKLPHSNGDVMLLPLS